MAKSMAHINSDGLVVNMEWHPDHAAQTDTLIDPGDRPVGIWDTYADGQFYRDGVRILTPLEEALAEIERLKAANLAQEAEKADMEAALALLGVTADMEVDHG